MNTIGFNNFRRFKTFPEIDLGDITILVGGNNAGKSTLVKAMLLVRDFLKSRIEGANKSTNIFNSIRPDFRFDAEHVNVGDFYRAFCRQSPRKEDTISFTMKIDSFHFIVKIRGERKPGVIPVVSLIAVSDEKRNVSFTFDFTKAQMTAHFSYDEEALNSDMLYDYPIERQIKDLKNKLSRSKDLEEISELKLRIEQLEKEEYALRQDKHIEEYDDVTINMSLFFGDNAGKLVIPELIKGFSHYADTGSLGDKRSKEYKVEEANKNFLRGKKPLINEIAKDLENTLNKQVIEYIYAHSVSQTPCYSNATSSNDYTIKTIHEFYTSRISSGDEEFTIVEKWLKEFGIGNSLKVIPFIGDSYRLVVFDDDNPEIASSRKQGYPGGMDLADKGMGSIQLVILLIRIATLIRKYKGQNLTVLLEEPEQNLHPALQSKLADLIYEINKNFGIRFIIETHSEYLVRHTQVLAAKQIYEEARSLGQVNKSIKVYYLSQVRGVIDMLFMGNAKFQDAFDEGFFDQAARESLTISRLERINKEK